MAPGSAMLKLVLAITLALTTSSGAAVPARERPSARLERVVESYRANGVTDAVVLVARDGVPIYRKAFGLADREQKVANRPETIFRIGSLTKQFTALAVLKLAADGRLSLDDPVSRFVENAPAAWGAVTIRHLLTHTSGIPNHTASPDWVGQNWMDRDADDLVVWARAKPLEAAPGARFQYDNAGYVILGLIVRKASGEGLSDYLTSHVFKPLGMRRTGFVRDPAPRLRAKGYVREGDAWREAPWLSAVRESGAGSLYSTADDLLRWDQALRNPRRLGLADLTPMFTDWGHGFGFGYVVGTESAHRVWWHNGHVDGYSAMLARYPDDRLTIIVLSNDDAAPVEKLSRALAASYLTRG